MPADPPVPRSLRSARATFAKWRASGPEPARLQPVAIAVQELRTATNGRLVLVGSVDGRLKSSKRSSEMARIIRSRAGGTDPARR